MKNQTNEKRSEQVKTPGELLRTARQAAGLTISDISQRLLLSERVIQWLENDEYTQICARVYAEGYLRAYAKLLNLTREEILAAFAHFVTTTGCYPSEAHDLNYTETKVPHPSLTTIFIKVVHKCGCYLKLKGSLKFWLMLGVSCLLFGSAWLFLPQRIVHHNSTSLLTETDVVEKNDLNIPVKLAAK